MNTISRTFLALGAIALLLATVIGAYGTHALASTLSAERSSAFATAVDYEFYHGLGLLAVAALTERQPGNWWLRSAGTLLCAGIVLFCGGIYLTTFGAPAAAGLATPVGGTAFMAGWAALALGAWHARDGRPTDALA